MKILFADDHEVIRQIIRKILQDEYPSAIIEEVKDGQELVAKVIGGHWDVVISDISMPVMNGLEAVREIRKHSKTLPVLILSSHTEEEYVRHALKEGATAYVHKYQAHDELGKTIRRSLKVSSDGGGEIIAGTAVTQK
jgi:DNA-binding NarL/FixJ family response regulator